METINSINNAIIINDNKEISDKNSIKLEIDIKIKEDKSKKIRVSNRYILFATERKEILDKIFEILSITDTEKSFYSHDFNEDKINSIFNLEDKIKMYFNTSSWSGFRQGIVKTKHLSIIKFIFKDMQVKYITKSFKIRLNKQYVNTTKYTIV